MPIRPVLFGFLAGVNPFRQNGHTGQGRLGGFHHLLLRQARRQRINRLIQRQRSRLVQPQHMIRMHHLGNAVKNLELARHNPDLAGGQQFLQKLRFGVKKNQLKLNSAITDHHAVGAALGTRRKMACDLYLHCNNGRGQDIPHRGAAGPVYPRIGQCKDQIARGQNAQCLKILCRFWAHPRKCFQSGIKRKQNFRPPAHA